MYVKKEDGKTYVYVRGGLTYVSAAFIESTTVLRIYMPDGSLLTNASVTVNDAAYTTDADGRVYLSGEYGQPASLSVMNADGYTGQVRVSYGTDAAVTLRMYLLTVIASGFQYSDYFTVTTTVDGESCTGSQELYLPAGASVTVKAVGSSDSSWRYDGSAVAVDGVSTGKTSYTFTMDADHTITFTDGSQTYIGSGT